MPSNKVPTMTRAQVKKVIKFSVEASGDIKLPLLIWGYHGVGKTVLVSQVSEEVDYNLVVLHLATQDIIDLIGRPVSVERKDPDTGEIVNVQEWCIPSWLQDARELSKKNGKPTIFFLDEFNRGPRIVLNAMLPFLIEGKMHTHKVGQKDVIIAAANPPSDDYEVNELEDKAQLDRLGHVVMKTSVEEYIKYLKGSGMDQATINVISGNRDLVNVPKVDPGIELTPSMRSVDYVMRVVGKKDNKWIKNYGAQVIHAYLGERFKDLWIAERSKYNDTITMEMVKDYKNNEKAITIALTAEIDGQETSKLSMVEKLIENVVSHLEEQGGLEPEDCSWFIPLIENKRINDEEIANIFSKPVIKRSLIREEVNARFSKYVKGSKIFNKSGVEIW